MSSMSAVVEAVSTPEELNEYVRTAGNPSTTNVVETSPDHSGDAWGNVYKTGGDDGTRTFYVVCGIRTVVLTWLP